MQKPIEYGQCFGEQGQSDKAVVSFEKALSLEPNYAEVHRQLSSLIKYKSNNAQMKLVSQLLKKPELKDADRCHLNYAFAKMNEDLGNLGIAFENYVAGGEIRRKLMFYDKNRMNGYSKKLK